MSLPLTKHTSSSWLPVCSCKHAGKSFLSTQKQNNGVKKIQLYAVLKQCDDEGVGGIFFVFHELFVKDWTASCKQWSSS